MIRLKVKASPVKFRLAQSPALRFGVQQVTVVSNASNDPYEGPYDITPKVEAQLMETKNKYMKDDVTVKAVPYYEMDNQKGTTIYIASEV